MTVKIALFLSSDGIALAHRQPAGYWAMIGETAYDVPNLADALADLRALAVEREGETFETLLVLPDDQILYTSLTAPTSDPELTAYRIEEGLDGLTPYAVTELEYDWCMLEEDRVKIAVVARETLDEARSFAAQYGFAGAGFAAMPPMERFPGVPTFELGDQAAELGFTAEGIAFGPDNFGTDAPEPEPEPLATPPSETDHEADAAPGAPEPDLAPSDLSDAETVTPDAGSETAPLDDDVAATPRMDAAEPSQDDAAETGTETEPDDAQWSEDDRAPVSGNAALADALMAANAMYDDEPEHDGESTPSAVDDIDADMPVVAIEDPSLSGPIASISDGRSVELSSAGEADGDEAVGDAGWDDDQLPPPPSPAAQVARDRARAIRGDSSALPPRTSGDGGQLAANRGPIDSPEGARGTLVGQRNSRLGFAHPDDPAPKLTAPDGAPTISAPTADAPPRAAGDGAMPRLAEQLQRVRSASKTRPRTAAKEASTAQRPRVEINTTPALGSTGASAQRRPSPFDDPPSGQTPSAEAPAKGGSLAGLLGRRSGGSATNAKKAGGTTGRGNPLRGGKKGMGAAPVHATGSVEPKAPAADESFTSGLLARKTVAPAGGSFRTGLILTVILLLLLAIVAIWSAVFLPNSPVARFFGGEDPDAMADVAPVAGLQAPDVFSDVPLIGQSGDALPTLEDEAAADGMDLATLANVVEETPAPALDPALDPASAPASAPAPAVIEVAAVQPEESLAEDALPDIDADLDLPPLPPIEQRLNPTLAEAEALYVEDGIWARSPERPDLRPFDLMDRVYTAAIDPVVPAVDAVALPDPSVNPGELLRRFPPPPPYGAEFDLTPSGQIVPTSEGVMTPEGAFVISGRPAIVAVPRPREVATAAPAIAVADAVLAAFRPAERPGDLDEIRERQVLGGLTETELGERRPAARPASPQEMAARASLFPGVDEALAATLGDDTMAETAPPDAAAVEVAALVTDGTELAVARSLLPRIRPANIEQIVASAERAPAEDTAAVPVEVVAAAPAIPSNSDVSRAATERNAIRLRNVNLIGVTGTPSERRALVRLSSGRFVRVGVGDRLDGGRVAAIGETTLQYVRSGRTVTLEIPG